MWHGGCGGFSTQRPYSLLQIINCTERSTEPSTQKFSQLVAFYSPPCRNDDPCVRFLHCWCFEIQILLSDPATYTRCYNAPPEYRYPYRTGSHRSVLFNHSVLHKASPLYLSLILSMITKREYSDRRHLSSITRTLCICVPSCWCTGAAAQSPC